MSLLSEIGELLYPWPLNCMHCGEPSEGDGLLCAKCRSQLDEDAPHIGFATGDISGSAAAHGYKGPAGLMVRLLKYRTLKTLAAGMAAEMLRAANMAGLETPDMVTYVPMHWRHRQSRYINQAQVLAKLVADALGVPCVRALKRIRGGKTQARISDENARLKNMKGAFAARADVQDKRILLIDDVYTTGATSRECAQALHAGGAKAVDILVYCLAHDKAPR